MLFDPMALLPIGERRPIPLALAWDFRHSRPAVDRGGGLATTSTEAGGGAMAHLELSAHMTVRAGCLDGFKKQAAECVRITREKDTRTLRYDWFLSSDGTECEVREAYTGPEGLIEHNTNILEARTKLFRDYADDHFMTVYGDPSALLLDLFKAHNVAFKWFSFVEGLERAPVLPSRFPAAVREAAQTV